MNIVRANDPSAVFDTLLYGGNSTYINTARDRIDRYLTSMKGLGRRIGGLLNTVRDYVYDPNRIMEAKQLIGETAAYIAEDAIYPILSDDIIPSPYMQALIMQNGEIWNMYKENEIYGYEETRLFDRYDDNIENLVNSGWIDDKEEYGYYVSSDGPDLDMVDQINIRDTWDYMLHRINTDVIDPTSIIED